MKAQFYPEKETGKMSSNAPYMLPLTDFQNWSVCFTNKMPFFFLFFKADSFTNNQSEKEKGFLLL